MTKEILVVDDEIGIRELLSEILYDEGYKVHLAESAAVAQKVKTTQKIDLVLLDIWMPEKDGLALLKEWVEEGALDIPVVMMSGHGTIETAMEAIRVGASDFLEKPIALQRLLTTVNKLIQEGKKTLDLQSYSAPSSKLFIPFSEEENILDRPLREAREYFDRMYFEHQLKKEHGNIAKVAEIAGIERTHLYRKLKQLGIKPSK